VVGSVLGLGLCLGLGCGCGCGCGCGLRGCYSLASRLRFMSGLQWFGDSQVTV
jgi:hypothetical protein